MSTNKAKVVFAVPSRLKNELRTRVIKEGYGLRGKSMWIEEAVENLLSYKDFSDLISYNDEMSGFDTMETATISYSLKSKIDSAIIDVRTKHPVLEGVKSRIMRTAILQRLLRS